MENSNLIQDETLQAIADAIREVDGTKDEILVREYADRIKNLVETDILKLLEKYGDCQKLYLPTVTGYDGQHYTATWAQENINTGTLYSYNSTGKVTKSTDMSSLSTVLNQSAFNNFSSNGIIARTGKNYSTSAVPAGAQFYAINPSAGYFLQAPTTWTNLDTYVVPSGKSLLSVSPKAYIDTEKMHIDTIPKQVSTNCKNNVDGGSGTVTFTSISSVKGADGSTYTYKINSGSEFITRINGDYYCLFGYIIVGEPGAVVKMYTGTSSTLKDTITIGPSGYIAGIIEAGTLKLQVVSGTVYRLTSMYI